MSETTIEVPVSSLKTSTQNSPEMMRAIVRTRFGSPHVLQLQEIETPVPKDGQVLVKVEASSINASDNHTLKGPPIILRLFLPLFKLNMGIRKPKETMLGGDLSGRVVAIGKNVAKYHVGDDVFGVSTVGSGSYAEYALAREVRLSTKPSNVSYEQAGVITGAGTTALQALRDKGKIRAGSKVLINGAGGGVGTFAVQIAKAFGAEVTAVTNTSSQDLARQLGADHVIDYTKEDYTRKGLRYDLIVDIASTHSFGTYKRLLNPNGTFVLVGMKDKMVPRLLYFILLRRFLGRGDKKFLFFIAKINDKDLDTLRDLLKEGKVVSVIDSRYQLSETPEAFTHFEKGNIRGKVVIRPGQN